MALPPEVFLRFLWNDLWRLPLWTWLLSRGYFLIWLKFVGIENRKDSRYFWNLFQLFLWGGGRASTALFLVRRGLRSWFTSRLRRSFSIKIEGLTWFLFLHWPRRSKPFIPAYIRQACIACQIPGLWQVLLNWISFEFSPLHWFQNQLLHPLLVFPFLPHGCREWILLKFSHPWGVFDQFAIEIKSSQVVLNFLVRSLEFLKLTLSQIYMPLHFLFVLPFLLFEVDVV